MIYIYNLIFYQPLLNALIFLYQTIAFKDLGVAIVLLTLLIRIILFPIFHKSVRHQTVMQKLQPRLKKIQEENRHNKEKQVQEMMAVYREHRVNPFSGFLLLLVQLPFLIALYQIFFNSLKPEFLADLYSFVSRPAAVGHSFLGLIDLGSPSILMVGLAAIAQYFQGKLALPKTEKGQELGQAERMGRQMVFIGPLLTLVIFYSLPAAISLYWTATSLFSIFQQLIINKQLAHGKLGKFGETNH
jgi:YidC/Oxa1 family membrane protein insertase